MPPISSPPRHSQHIIKKIRSSPSPHGEGDKGGEENQGYEFMYIKNTLTWWI